LNADLGDTVLRRRSGSEFGSIGTAQLEALLAFSLAPRSIAADGQREYRPVPSAGAIHAIHLVVAAGSNWQVFLPRTHSLRGLQVDEAIARDLWREIGNLKDPGKGSLLLLLAEHGAYVAAYENPETLILRETGCIQAHLGLVAEGLHLSYRILGATGEPWASRLLTGAEGLFMGVGTALVGSR
jgi:hypothetical protein